jgi:predicted O-methyltransferase YrrM
MISFTGFLSGMNSHLQSPTSFVQLESLVHLSSFGIGYVPWSSSSMTPKAITCILNEIILNKKTRILELGMGISTFYITRLMKDHPKVSLLSIDNDEVWIQTCREQLYSKDLSSERHKTIHAPLKNFPSDHGMVYGYYDLDSFRDEVSKFSPDLLIIDGPPAWNPDISDARVPAFYFFLPLLSSESTVIIDDYTRSGESKLLELFLTSSTWSVAFQDALANISIIRNSIVNYNSF